MRGSTMVAKCTELGIECTYNRARHSNDNAHMEASFKLLKHGHEVAIPEAFNTLKHAKNWVEQYYHWYNHNHRHSGICYITPQQCTHLGSKFWTKWLPNFKLLTELGKKSPTSKVVR